jgi:hypothetical protein
MTGDSRDKNGAYYCSESETEIFLRSIGLSIYNKITNSSEQSEIIKRIDDMVDMTNNSINEKCSRIKEAFVSKIDDSLAQYYYITGKRGAPKKVSIPTNLIVFK